MLVNVSWVVHSCCETQKKRSEMALSKIASGSAHRAGDPQFGTDPGLVDYANLLIAMSNQSGFKMIPLFSE